jgi:uncharacterized protein YkwD
MAHHSLHSRGWYMSVIPARIGLRFIAAALLAASCSGLPTRQETPEEPGSGAAPGSLDLQIHEQVNRHRQSAGLPPLTWSSVLADLAAAHSRRMASGEVPFGHDGFEERVATARQAIGVSRAAENVATNNYPVGEAAARVVQGWLASPGHRRNIDGAFQLTGVGVARTSSGTYFATQLYAAP